MQEKLDRYRNFDEYRQELVLKEAALKRELLKLCEKVSKIRKKSAESLAQSMRRSGRAAMIRRLL